MNEQKTLASGEVIVPEMIEIPAGTFLMGSPVGEPGRWVNEEQHEVVVEAFGMAKCAVTFDEFDVFALDTGRELPRDFGWGRGRRPVVDVSWRDAMAYCAWLSQKTGQRFRLPTEAEWEYAARAGTTTAYWWGEEYEESRARSATAVGWTVEVDAYEPNPWGLYNMLGNVWEWTGSAYEEQWDGSEQRCAEQEQAGRRVVRGGSWFGIPGNLRSAARARFLANYRNGGIGFRLAVDR